MTVLRLRATVLILVGTFLSVVGLWGSAGQMTLAWIPGALLLGWGLYEAWIPDPAKFHSYTSRSGELKVCTYGKRPIWHIHVRGSIVAEGIGSQDLYASALSLSTRTDLYGGQAAEDLRELVQKYDAAIAAKEEQQGAS